MGDLDKDEVKAAMKEAITEWLDKQFASFGKWTARGIGALLLGGLLYLFAISQGWHK